MKLKGEFCVNDYWYRRVTKQIRRILCILDVEKGKYLSPLDPEVVERQIRLIAEGRLEKSIILVHIMEGLGIQNAASVIYENYYPVISSDGKIYDLELKCFGRSISTNDAVEEARLEDLTPADFDDLCDFEKTNTKKYAKSRVCPPGAKCTTLDGLRIVYIEVHDDKRYLDTMLDYKGNDWKGDTCFLFRRYK